MIYIKEKTQIKGKLYKFEKNEKGYFSQSQGKIAFLDRSNTIIPKENEEYDCITVKEFDKFKFVKIDSVYDNSYIAIEEDKIKFYFNDKEISFYLDNFVLNKKIKYKIEEIKNYFGKKLYQKSIVQFLKINKKGLIEIGFSKKARKEVVFSEGFKCTFCKTKFIDENTIKIELIGYNNKNSMYNYKLKEKIRKIAHNYEKIIKSYIVKKSDIANKYNSIKQFANKIHEKINKKGNVINIEGFKFETYFLFSIIENRKLDKIEKLDYTKEHEGNIINNISKTYYTYTHQISEKERCGTSYTLDYQQAKVGLIQRISLFNDLNEDKFKKEDEVKTIIYKIN